MSARTLLEFHDALPKEIRVVEEADHGVTPTYMVVADYEWCERILCGGCYDHDAELIATALREAMERADDPRALGGAISGPGGPYDENAVVIDTKNAVILEACEVAIVGGVRKGILDPKPIMTIVLRGRVNKTNDRTQALYMMNEDGAAGIVTQIIGMASRSGWGSEFMERMDERMKEMPL